MQRSMSLKYDNLHAFRLTSHHVLAPQMPEQYAPTLDELADQAEPQTPNPKPQTRNPKPETRNPKPETRNPKPETRNPKP